MEDSLILIGSFAIFNKQAKLAKNWRVLCTHNLLGIDSLTSNSNKYWSKDPTSTTSTSSSTFSVTIKPNMSTDSGDWVTAAVNTNKRPQGQLRKRLEMEQLTSSPGTARKVIWKEELSWQRKMETPHSSRMGSINTTAVKVTDMEEDPEVAVIPAEVENGNSKNSSSLRDTRTKIRSNNNSKSNYNSNISPCTQITAEKTKLQQQQQQQ